MSNTKPVWQFAGYIALLNELCYPNDARRVQFSHGRMTGTAVDTVGTEISVDERAPSDFFDYSIMTLVADHLPLEVGFQGVLATYDITRGSTNRYRSEGAC